MPFTYAIADLHGRYDPLSEAVTKIAGALSRAIARRERPPPAIGIEAKSCSEFRAEEVPFLIIDPPGQGQLPPWLRRTNVWLRVTNSARWARRLRSEPPIDVQHGLRPRRRLDEAARRASRASRRTGVLCLTAGTSASPVRTSGRTGRAIPTRTRSRPATRTLTSTTRSYSHEDDLSDYRRHRRAHTPDIRERRDGAGVQGLSRGKRRRKQWRVRACRDGNPAACDYDQAQKQSDPIEWCGKRYPNDASQYRFCLKGSPDR